ncbi:MAG: type IV toxin-antitoxin system AbiEi family antitoxin domain-containing protein [Pseudoclavibacter sp.]
MEFIDVRTGRYDSFERRQFQRGALDGTYVRVRPGVYTRPASVGTPEGWHRLLLAATMPRLAAVATVSHTSAAVLHGLPVLRDRLEVVTTTRPGSNGKRSRLVHARRGVVRPDERIEHRGIPVTSLERTVVDLARALPFGEALAAADVAVRKGHDLRGLAERASLPLRVRKVARFANGLAESVGESMSRAVFIQAKLPPATLQFEVVDREGRLFARCDFGWPEWDVLGEFDGDVKYRGALPGARDPARANREEKDRIEGLRDLGYDPVQWGWRVMQTPGMLVARVTRTLVQHGYRRGQPESRSW